MDDNYMLPYKYDEVMEARRWSAEIPYIKFPKDWEIAIIPPFAGAVVRFKVKKDEASISVYLDCYERLGLFGEPYWEIYPYEDDVYRVAMKNTDELLQRIGESIDKQNANAQST